MISTYAPQIFIVLGILIMLTAIPMFKGKYNAPGRSAGYTKAKAVLNIITGALALFIGITSWALQGSFENIATTITVVGIVIVLIANFIVGRTIK